MNTSLLQGLPLEVQRVIVHGAMLVTDADLVILPLDLTILRTCRQLRDIGLGVLQHEYRWIRYTIHCCVDSILQVGNETKLLKKCGILFTKLVRPKRFSLEVTACSCARGHIHYATDQRTRSIIIPFETSTLAQLCEMLKRASEEQNAEIIFDFDGLDRSPQMVVLREVVRLKMHMQAPSSDIGSIESSAGRSQPDAHQLVPHHEDDMQYTIAFLGRQLRGAQGALHANQYQYAIDHFFHARNIFSEACIGNLIRTPDPSNNTVAILFAYLGFAAFQAHCRTILVRLIDDWHVSNQIRILCLRAATIYPGMNEADRLGIYLWNMACIGILIKSAPSTSCVNDLDAERRRYFKSAKRLRDAALWNSHVFQFFENQTLEDMTLSTDLVLFLDGMIWRGSRWLFQLWDQPRPITRRDRSRWQQHQVDIIGDFNFDLSDDMDAILLRTIRQEA